MNGMEHYKKDMSKEKAHAIERTVYGSDDFNKSDFERLNDSLDISEDLIAQKEEGLKKVKAAIAFMNDRLKTAQTAQFVHGQAAAGHPYSEYHSADFNAASSNVADISKKLEGLQTLLTLQERVITDLKGRREGIEHEKNNLVKTAYLEEDGFPKFGDN